MKTLVIDVGGMQVKPLAAGWKRAVILPSGPELTPRRWARVCGRCKSRFRDLRRAALRRPMCDSAAGASRRTTAPGRGRGSRRALRAPPPSHHGGWERWPAAATQSRRRSAAPSQKATPSQVRQRSCHPGTTICRIPVAARSKRRICAPETTWETVRSLISRT